MSILVLDDEVRAEPTQNLRRWKWVQPASDEDTRKSTRRREGHQDSLRVAGQKHHSHHGHQWSPWGRRHLPRDRGRRSEQGAFRRLPSEPRSHHRRGWRSHCPLRQRPISPRRWRCSISTSQSRHQEASAILTILKSNWKRLQRAKSTRQAAHGSPATTSGRQSGGGAGGDVTGGLASPPSPGRHLYGHAVRDGRPGCRPVPAL